jgi:hypothetical protein
MRTADEAAPIRGATPPAPVLLSAKGLLDGFGAEPSRARPRPPGSRRACRRRGCRRPQALAPGRAQRRSREPARSSVRAPRIVHHVAARVAPARSHCRGRPALPAAGRREGAEHDRTVAHRLRVPVDRWGRAAPQGRAHPAPVRRQRPGHRRQDGPPGSPPRSERLAERARGERLGPDDGCGSAAGRDRAGRRGGRTGLSRAGWPNIFCRSSAPLQHVAGLAGCSCSSSI